MMRQNLYSQRRFLRFSAAGAFAPAVNYPAGSFPGSVVASDLDGDGRPDLVCGDVNSDDRLSVLVNLGDGTFGPLVNYTAGSAPISLAAADCNGDGRADLAVANVNGDNVTVILNICSP
jgi:hypothetical protein